ncbi:MAG: Rne/Rng family ribonuclease [Lentisphaeria bacterium]|nr:Rne/Rng family ribonuclease [Lentisphaeria bacterium]
MKQILINSEELQTRVAVVKDGLLQDFFMERNDRDTLVGSIFKAKIKNLEPSLQAAFVDIGQGKNAFLHYWDMLPATQEMLEGDEENDDAEAEKTEDKPQEGASKSKKRRPPRRRKNPAAESAGQSETKPEEAKPRPAQPAPEPKTSSPQIEVKSSFLRRVFGKFLTKGNNAPAAQNPLVQDEPGKTKPENPGRQDLQPGKSEQSPNKPETAHRAKPPRKRQPRPPQFGKSGKSGRPGHSVADIPDLFKVDQEILVQVTKGPIGNKGARVTTNLSIPGRFLVLLPNSPHSGISRRVEEREERSRLRQIIRALKLPSNMGLICRTVGAGVKQEHFQRDLDMLLDSWHKGQEQSDKQRAPYCVYQEPGLAERILRDCLTEDIDEVVADSEEDYKCATSLLMRYSRHSKVKVKLYQNPTPIFAKYGVSKQIDNISQRKVALPSGGYICIDETEAMIAIDVNSGKNRSGKDHPETILTTNLEAVKEIARQLRLRNIGGLVVLDLIDMRLRKDQQTVYKTFKDLLAEDRARVKTYPISQLGLLEMTRQRENESLESAIYDDCPYCKGRGLVKSSITMSVEIQRRLNEILAKRKNITHLLVSVNPKVMERLRSEDRELFDSMGREFGKKVTLNSDPALHIEEFKILDKDSNKTL